ncbi:acetoacetate--CoA ligase [Trinickia violacea]|uniref:Acetoacetate--CoA ligase n=1 Tax=Trinickia violacea TaxID=2571746 RepID=A0A4P8ISN9_9BURK|nr:acetoacetate--CoA ligase [Trinickia violacea]QCP50014.1 acetoacetate--CoA ligase [Trinickia violacea]
MNNRDDTIDHLEPTRTLPIYTPPPERVPVTQLTAFTAALRVHTGEALPDYAALHAFSVREYRAFWRFFIDWAQGFDYSGNPEPVCVGDVCERATFFPHIELSYADNLLSFDVAPTAAPAITACHADGTRVRLTRCELRERVARLAAALERLGLRSGDRVAAVMRSDERAVIVALAVAAIGATLSTASPEMGGEALVDRFGQLSPTWLFVHTVVATSANARTRASGVATLVSSLESVEHVVVLDDEPLAASSTARIHFFKELSVQGNAATFTWRRFPFNHPLFIMFSSGTTGKPKCIMHGAGGSLIEHLKEHRLHSNLDVGDKLYFHTSCAWMMWNWQLSALASGVEIVTYDGPITKADTLWRLVADEQVTVFGTSPAYLRMCNEAGLQPWRQFDLSALRAMMSTGAVLFDMQFRWVMQYVKPLQLQSISGGTDILGCFVLGNPHLPVWCGEAQCRSLALDVQAWDGGAKTDGVGELVCTNPFPSRPLGFFGDPDGVRFHDAYFSANPGIWTHGDQIEFSPCGGARLHGRSDGVLNVRGVNVGPGEIYRVLSDIAGIREAMVVEQRIKEKGDAHAYDRRVVLFVVLERGMSLTTELTVRVRRELARRISPTHVPNVILAVDELPVTHSGKLSDSAVRNAVNGLPLTNTAALRNPKCLDAIRQHPGLGADAIAVHSALPPVGKTAAELEAYLIALWENLFGFSPISRDDNFFDLGGDSLLGTALVTEVERASPYKMSLARLLVAPTIAQLAAAMLDDAGSNASETVVPVRNGTGAPVFWVHSIAGSVMECLPVILAMKSLRPFYGIHAKGLHPDEEPLRSVRDMALCYVREIRSIQPHGPYTLVGYSFGGLVAFEMALQLHRDGESIEQLCLLDTHVHDSCLPLADWLGYQLEYATRQWRMFREVRPAQRARYILKKLTGAADNIRLQFGKTAHKPAAAIAHLPQPLQRMREAMRLAMATYRLPRYDVGPIHFVRAALPVDDLCDPLPAWHRAARRGLEISRVGGSHVEMIVGRNAGTLAATLDRVLSEVQAQAANRM